MNTRNARKSRAAAASMAVLGMIVAPVTAASAAEGQPAPTVSLTRQSGSLSTLVANVDPNLAGSQDYNVTLQRASNGSWSRVKTGRTAGAREIATFGALPNGTYRLVVPAQFDKPQAISNSISVQRRTPSATAAKKSSTSIAVNVNPNLSGGAFRVVLDKRTSNGWRTYSSRLTTGTSEIATFGGLDSGTYRARTVATNSFNSVTTNSVKITYDRAAALRAKQQKVVSMAKAQIGKPYVHGATGPSAFDCSGLVQYTYKKALGQNLPRTASQQYYTSQATTRFTPGHGTPQPGDIIYFGRNGAQHVGLYVGGGKMVHAANPSVGVQQTTYSSGWYARSITGYSRVIHV